jgi:hypothetical protein
MVALHKNMFWVLQLVQLHTNQKGHMHLMTSELLNPCCFTHLVTKDIQLQSLVILTTKIFKFSCNNEIPCHH